MLTTIDYMKKEDCERVAYIENYAFSQPWSRQAFEKAVDDKNYIYICAKSDDVISGYAGCQVSFDDAEITNIAVSYEYRRNKIAETLLSVLIRKAKERGVKRIFLEVRVSNAAARALYEKFGFEKTGRRPRFYERPSEDALVMTKELKDA